MLVQSISVVSVMFDNKKAEVSKQHFPKIQESTSKNPQDTNPLASLSVDRPDEITLLLKSPSSERVAAVFAEP